MLILEVWIMRVDKFDKWNVLFEKNIAICRVRKNYTKRVINVICAHIKTSIKFLAKDARAALARFCKSRKIRVDAFALVKGQGAFKRGWFVQDLIRAGQVILAHSDRNDHKYTKVKTRHHFSDRFLQFCATKASWYGWKKSIKESNIIIQYTYNINDFLTVIAILFIRVR